MSRTGYEIERRPNGVYLSGDLIVSPHLTQEMLEYAYLRFAQEHTLEMIFHESDVPALDWFVRKYQEMPTLGLFRQRSGEQSADMLGLAWAGAVARVADLHTKAEIGFATFRHATIPMETLVLGQLAAMWAFERMGVEVLYGTTPEPNKAMLRFFRSLGFLDSGVIPMYTAYQGKPAGVVISYMTREMWEAAMQRPTLTLETLNRTYEQVVLPTLMAEEVA